jgi:dipeptidase
MCYRKSLSWVSWKNFATSLNYQRHEFFAENIIGSLDVKEKERKKYKYTGGTEGYSAASMVQENAHTFKGKNKRVYLMWALPFGYLTMPYLL